LIDDTFPTGGCGADDDMFAFSDGIDGSGLMRIE
jgi:hypothetical protein